MAVLLLAYSDVYLPNHRSLFPFDRAPQMATFTGLARNNTLMGNGESPTDFAPAILCAFATLSYP